MRSTCSMRKVGAVLVRDKRVLATGYNGSLPGDVHCDEVGCLIEDGRCARTIHAEQNIVLQCAKYGISMDGTTMYSTHRPCLKCAKLIAGTGIQEIIARDGDYTDEMLNIYHNAGITCTKI